MVEVSPWSNNVVVCLIDSVTYWGRPIFRRVLIYGVFAIMGSASHLGANSFDDWSRAVVITAIY